MKERPILFSAPMVVALREDRKTQTRRTRGLDRINEEPDTWTMIGQEDGAHYFSRINHGDTHVPIRCPYGVVGDRLWTRETWRTLAMWDFLPPKGIPNPGLFPMKWDADNSINGPTPYPYGKTRPGMFMLRELSRDMLEVISARPERLQAITEADAKAEGCSADQDPFWHPTYADPDSGGNPSARNSFEYLWHEINGAKSWMENPFVWRVEFTRMRER